MVQAPVQISRGAPGGRVRCIDNGIVSIAKTRRRLEADRGPVSNYYRALAFGDGLVVYFVLIHFFIQLVTLDNGVRGERARVSGDAIGKGYSCSQWRWEGCGTSRLG